MKVRAKNIFTTVRAEGAILPTDLLQRIVDNDNDLDGLTPAAYHLLEGEKLNEAINRSWSRLRGAWASFQGGLERLPESDAATKVTRDRILLPLFQELGYGRLTTTRAIDIEGKAYPISHLWQNTPIHLVGYRVDLDKRTAGVAGAARSSPHSLVQEFLNRSDDHLWAFVSNGRRLRILRDNASLTRQAYVEFDLEAMMAGEVYADFVLLWLLCHQSRVEVRESGVGNRESGAASTPDSRLSTPQGCWLEKWSKIANDQGKRALDALRDGVESAISSLGQGFLTHSANRTLRHKLQSGELATQDYYRQLLRLVYRLLFLFVAEDRELLLDPNAEPTAKDRYTLYYSTARLRTLAEKRRGTRHSDLFHGLRLVMEKLGSEHGCPELALPALGSFLWSSDAVKDLLGELEETNSQEANSEIANSEIEAPLLATHYSATRSPRAPSCQIANADLLDAIRALAFITDKHGRRPVDYKNLQSEELGSVYESLLELHPELNISTGTFSLKTASGNERKTTGSYYTPESLVQCLLDSALDPVIEDTIKRASRGVANSEIGGGNTKGTSRSEQTSGSVVSRSEGLARRNEAGRNVLPADSELSQGRNLRNDLSNSESSGISPGEYSRGLGTGEPQGVHSVSQNRSGLSKGTGNSSNSGDESKPDQSRVRGSTSQPKSGSRQDASGSNSLDSGESQVASDSSPTRYSATHYSPTSPVETALLNLKICDPACGSGHFLIAAAHRLAKRLAFVRTGDEEPAPEATQTALRDVIGRCIYGVDVNPMAVELCKVALWMEALEPGKPLSFLDHHIQCGNSLLGATPALLRQGIPDDAFKPIEGDDKAYCSKYKKQNKEERKGQLSLLTPDLQPWERLGDLATSMAQVDDISDDDYAGVQRKRQQYEAMVQSTPYLFSRFWADAWCAAFVWIKRPPSSEEANSQKANSEIANGEIEDPLLTTRYSATHSPTGFPYPITEEVFRRIERNPHSVDKWMRDEVERLRDQYQFFHWHLAFPDVFQVRNGESGVESRESEDEEGLEPGWDGGFDVVLGNPPWERMKFQEKEWFILRAPEIAELPSARERARHIQKLKVSSPELDREYQFALRHAEAENALVRFSGRFKLVSGGDINTYAVFTETAISTTEKLGRIGIIIPSAITSALAYQPYISQLVENGKLVSCFDFENQKAFFPEVHSSYRFCILTLRGDGNNEEAMCGFMLHEIADIRDKNYVFELRKLSGAENFFESHNEQLERSNQGLEPIALVHFLEKLKNCRLFENPLLTRVSGVFCTTKLRKTDLSLLNPNTKAFPVFQTRNDATLVRQIHSSISVLVNESTHQNPWGIKIYRMIDANESEEIIRNDIEIRNENIRPDENWVVLENQKKWLRVYEGKMIDLFNHRYATSYTEPGGQRSGKAITTQLDDLRDPFYSVGSRYWVQESTVLEKLPDWNRQWLVSFMDVCSATNIRTMIPAIIPLAGATKSLRIVKRTNQDSKHINALYANWGAFVFDYVTRQSISGLHLSEHIVKQLPVLSPDQYAEKDLDFILPRILELTYTAWDLQPFAQDCGYEGPPFKWDEDRRFLLRCELDAAYFHLYGIQRDDVDYIMETFPIVKRKDEKAHGHYRTKDTILQIYDAMATAIASGQPYQTLLDPPPADPRVAHPPRKSEVGSSE
jgi:hypothetical protein